MTTPDEPTLAKIIWETWVRAMDDDTPWCDAPLYAPDDAKCIEACAASIQALYAEEAAKYAAAHEALDDLAREKVAAAEARVKELEGERDEARAALAVCRQSLTEQALARADPNMPRLTPKVLERLSGDAEAAYALAEDADDRIAAHGLSLLVDWQNALSEKARS